MSDRDLRRNRPPPTAVRAAIAQGSQPLTARVITSSDAQVVTAVEDVRSTPIGISQLDRIEFRQQQNDENVLELARGIGDLQHNDEKIITALESLVKLAERDDEREQKREDAAAAAAIRREEREAETAKDRRTSRERIMLAILGIVATAATGFGIGRFAGGTTTPALPAPVPHVGTP